MARPYDRRRYINTGGGGIDLSTLFGEAGGASVTPVEPGNVPYTDPTFDARTQVRFKPEHPILNVLSGFKGTGRANALNTEQIVNAAADAQQTAALKERQANQSAIQLKALATENFIKHTGVLPEERPDLYKRYVSEYATKLMGLGEAETEEATAKAKTGKTVEEQTGTTLEQTFPERLAASKLQSMAAKNVANTAVTATRGGFGREAAAQELLDTQQQERIAAEPMLHELEMAKEANVVMPHGVYNKLTGKFIPFPASLLQTTPAFQNALGIQSPVGQVVDYDPVLGQNIIRKSGAAVKQPVGVQSTSSGITAKPITLPVAPSGSQFKLSDMYNPVAIGKQIGSGVKTIGNAATDAVDTLNYLRELLRRRKLQFGDTTIDFSKGSLY